jgi:hypothetical protein
LYEERSALECAPKFELLRYPNLGLQMYERKVGEKGDRRGVSRNEANTAYRLSVVVAYASEVYLRDAYR